MGYRKTENLYANNTILHFKEIYALEKIHGTSAHIKIEAGEADMAVDRGYGIKFFSGGEKAENFKKLFNETALLEAYKNLKCFGAEVTVYGEAYGGKQQGMSATYGKDLKFVVFEVKVGETWLSVPDAEDVAKQLGLEFVAYNKIPATVEAIDAERDLPSRQAKRNGIAEDKVSEGVVLRPLLEFLDHRGNRIIVKHKHPDFSERASKRDTLADPIKEKALADAEAIASEWVVMERLKHVLSALAATGLTVNDMTSARQVIQAMVEDIYLEGKGQVVESPEATKAIGAATGKLLKKYLNERIE